MVKRIKGFMKKHPIWTTIIFLFIFLYIIGLFLPDETSSNFNQDLNQKNTSNTPLLQNESQEQIVNNSNNNPIQEKNIEKNIKIANWNLQIFGDTKASNPTLMNFYSKVVEDYDIIFIQEIRDSDGSAFTDLCSLLKNYNCEISSRAGRSSSKEQYGVIYKEEIEIRNFKDFNPDSQDRWERPPIEVTFNIDGYELIVYNIHIKPDDVLNEMDNLADIVKINGNVIVIGDLNADCNYYDNSKEQEFDNWNWLISDNQDTTSSSTDCAYDRIILNDDAKAEYVSSGIYSNGITSDVSDHYLIWLELNPNDIYVNSNESPRDPNSSNTIPKQTETTGSDQYVCSSDYYNCGDFSSHAKAQEVFDYCKSQGKGDIHRLDNDDDDNPCESLS